MTDAMLAAGFVDALPVDELPPGEQRVVHIGNDRVLVLHTEDGLFAIRDLCPHALQPMAGGRLRGTQLSCPKHGARFDLRSGRPLNGVTGTPLTLFAVRVRAGRIEVATSGGFG